MTPAVSGGGRTAPGAGVAAAVYLAIAIAATWPLALGLGRDVPSDLGDPVFVMWVLAWDCEQLIAILGGDLGRIRTFFDANIFHPAPLALAYSDHLIVQAVQALPVYAATRNPILCYNLLFLSTFVLSALGAFLFVRELTGSPRAAFVAGLLYGFAPYRFPQASHLPVLSSQWMPFVLYGFRRCVGARVAGRSGAAALTGGAAALAAQALSSGYYLLYFTPFAGAYMLWELWARGRAVGWRVWLQLAGAAAAVALVVGPFLLPYAALRELFQAERFSAEVVRYSADVYSYATASAEQPIWGRLARVYPKPEGDLFPGIITLLLAAIGVGAAWTRSDPPAECSPFRRWLARLLAAAAAAHIVAAVVALLNRRILIDLWIAELQITDITRLLIRAALFAVALFSVSPAARARAAAFMRGPGFFLGATLAAAWLSLGPEPQVLGRPANLFAPYALLYEHVPGFTGLRVPARLAMVVTLMLSVLGGMGAAWIARRRYGGALLAVASLLFLAEALTIPMPVNGAPPVRGFHTPEPRVYRPARAPAIYHEVRNLPAGAVVAELPLGTPEFDIRAVFYSTVHWRRLVNGYSGYFPPHYSTIAVALSDVPRHPQAALDALRSVGATHVIVHEAAYPGDAGPRTSAALREAGATELFRRGGDILLELER